MHGRRSQLSPPRWHLERAACWAAWANALPVIQIQLPRWLGHGKPRLQEVATALRALLKEGWSDCPTRQAIFYGARLVLRLTGPGNVAACLAVLSYFQQHGIQMKKVQQLWDVLASIFDYSRKTSAIPILGGDFNATVGSALWHEAKELKDVGSGMSKTNVAGILCDGCCHTNLISRATKQHPPPCTMKSGLRRSCGGGLGAMVSACHATAGGPNKRIKKETIMGAALQPPAFFLWDGQSILLRGPVGRHSVASKFRRSIAACTLENDPAKRNVTRPPPRRASEQAVARHCRHYCGCFSSLSLYIVSLLASDSLPFGPAPRVAPAHNVRRAANCASLRATSRHLQRGGRPRCAALVCASGRPSYFASGWGPWSLGWGWFLMGLLLGAVAATAWIAARPPLGGPVEGS